MHYFPALLIVALTATAAERLVIDEDFRSGRTTGARLQDPGEFTPEGWRVNSPQCQLKFDLGRFYKRGRVELQVKGPLRQESKRSLFSAWNEEAAADGDRQTQGFFQLRVMDLGMMLRLTNRYGGPSFEGRTPPLHWDPQKWYRIEGYWDTAGGHSWLKRDGELLRRGIYNRPFEGFRWLFIGKDNYQRFVSIPGLVYARLRVWVDDDESPIAGRWEQVEIPVRNTKAYADPFRDVELRVTYTSPDGRKIRFWGFYDGAQTWKLRFMPDQLGQWRYEASFSDGAAGASGRFQCVESKVPGMLEVYPANPIWFAFRGGQPVLLRSLHVGDRFFAANWDEEKRRAFLDWAGKQGYNMLSVASHYLNRDAEGRGKGWQTPRLWPLNPAEYRKMERILNDLARRGMMVYPFAGFFGQKSNYPRDPKDQELYIRYTLARIGPYWNILLNVAGPEPNLQQRWMEDAEVIRLGELIRKLDIFHHPLSVHNRTGDDPYRDASWTSYGTLQGPKTVNRRRLSQGLLESHHPAKPLYAQETLWTGNKFHKEPYTDTDLRKNTYVIHMSGAMLNYGDMDGDSSSGFSGTLDLNDRHQERHDIVARAWDLIETTPWWTMKPRQDLVDNGYCLADPGTRYLIYLEQPGVVNVRLSGGPYRVRWINAAATTDIRDGGLTRDGRGLRTPEGGEDWMLDLRADGTEVATGRMLGAGHDARSFYLRHPGGGWKKTYSGDPYRPEAAGRLMNLRIAQGIFEDDWLSEVFFSPQDNTTRLIQALDTYRAHGVLAISVSLQGGNPAYEKVPEIPRDRPFKLGRGKGSLISAFLPDGSLKPSWTRRLRRLAWELDRRGMVLNLIIYYQHQDEVLSGKEAIQRGILNVVDWLIDNDCRNVILEIANEHDVASYDHDRYIHHNIGPLIELARARFAARKAPFRLPVSASTAGGGKDRPSPVYQGVRDHADLVIIHGNHRTPEEKRRRVAELVRDAAMPGPIYMNEDDNGRETTLAHLQRELASCDAVFDSGGSWGYMPWVQVQNFPFRHYAPADQSTLRDAMPEAERDRAYFKAVLEHIRAKVVKGAIR